MPTVTASAHKVTSGQMSAAIPTTSQIAPSAYDGHRTSWRSAWASSSTPIRAKPRATTIASTFTDPNGLSSSTTPTAAIASPTATTRPQRRSSGVIQVSEKLATCTPRFSHPAVVVVAEGSVEVVLVVVVDV